MSFFRMLGFLLWNSRREEEEKEEENIGGTSVQPAMATAENTIQLVETLGGVITLRTARTLLQQSNGSVEGAIEIHFSGGGSSAAEDEPGANESDTQLRQIVGPEPQLSYLKQLLRRFGGSVQRAAEAFFSDPPAPAPPVPSDQAAAGPSTAAVVNVDSDSDDGGPSPPQPAAQEPEQPAAGPAARAGKRRSSFGRNIQPSNSQAGRILSAQLSRATDTEDSSAEDEPEAAVLASPGADFTSDGEEAEPVFLNDNHTVGHSNRSGHAAAMVCELRDYAHRRPSKKLLRPSLIAQHKAKSFAKMVEFDIPRDKKGQLHVDSADDVPAKLVPKRESKMPLRLGTIHVPLTVDTKMNVDQAVKQGMGELLYFNMNAKGPWRLRVEIRAKKDLRSKKHILGRFAGPTALPRGECGPFGDLPSALGILLNLDFISLSHTLKLYALPTESPPTPQASAKPQRKTASAKGKEPAPDQATGKSSKSATLGPSHRVRLDLTVHLTEKAMQSTNRQGGQELCILFHYLLTEGSGFKVGPDCDGYLNLGHTPVQLEAEPRQADGAAASGSAAAGSSAEPSSAEPTPEPVKRATDVEKLLRAGGLDKNSPQAAAPRGLQSVPKGFQLQGLHWMQQREMTGDARGRGHLHLHPNFLQFLLDNGTLLHFQKTGGTCGGLLSDYMGLGKTLETLMLIMSHPPTGGWAVRQIPKRRPKALGKNRKVRLGEYDSYEAVPIKTTLIVVPANLRQQWATEIERHLQPGAVTWDLLPDLGEEKLSDLTQHGSTYEEGGRRRTKRAKTVTDPEEERARLQEIVCCNGTPMHECDIVLATYEQIRKELSTKLSSKQRSPLLNWGFWRLVLDEAQLVANSNSQAAVTVSQLWRRHAWVVTGTPVTASVNELQGLLEFLAAEPFYDSKVWESMNTGMDRLTCLQNLLHGLMLRRSQADVEGELALPPCTREDRWMKLSPTERICYERNLKEMLRTKQQVQDETNIYLKGHASLLRHFTQLRQVVRKDDALMGGSEHLSMADIMGRLVAKGFQEYDAAAQKAVRACMMHAAVLMDAGREEEAQAAFNSSVQDTAQGSKRAALLHMPDIMRFTTHDGSLVPPSEEPSGTFPTFQERQPQPQAAAAGPGNELDVEIGCERDSAPAKKARTSPNIAAHWPQQGAAAREPDGEAAGMDANGNGNASHAAAGDGQPGTSAAAAEGPAAAAKKRGKKRKKAAKKKAPPKEEKVEMTQEEQAAHERIRAWLRTQLEALELWAYAVRYDDEHQDYAERERRLQPVLFQIDELRERLGLPVAAAAAAEVAGVMGRRSRRQQDMDVDDDFSADQIADMQMRQASAANLGRDRRAMRDFEHLANLETDEQCVSSSHYAWKGAQAEARGLYKNMAHLHSKHMDIKDLEVGKQPHAADDTAIADGQSDPTNCPVCLDTPEHRAVTFCGHFFCSHCIHEILASSVPKCAVCRQRITNDTVFDAATDEDAAAARQRLAVKGDYGTKVGALVSELLDMKQKDPQGKAVVFSAWGRVLKLVGSALDANGISNVSLLGSTSSSVDARADAISQFQLDPSIKVILIIMSTTGGAAGLTLTAANTVFLMEPAINPGLEAQAAGRVHRLGQQRPTRVIRLLAQGTVEQCVLDSQAAKSHVGETHMLAADAYASTVMSILNSHPEPA